MYEYVQLCDDTTNKTASLEELFELLIAWKTICGSNRKGTVQSEHAGALQWHQSKVTMVPSSSSRSRRLSCSKASFCFCNAAILVAGSTSSGALTCPGSHVITHSAKLMQIQANISWALTTKLSTMHSYRAQTSQSDLALTINVSQPFSKASSSTRAPFGFLCRREWTMG